MEGQPIIVALRKEELAEILKSCAQVGARIGSQVAADTLREEYSKQEKQRKDRKLHNVRLLLSHYQDFMDHTSEAVYSSAQIEDDDLLESIMTMKNVDDEVIVESILRTNRRTQVMLAHIDKAIHTFQIWANDSGRREQRQLKVIEDYYMRSPRKSMKELAEEHGVSKATIHSDIKDAEERLAVLLFGMDGLKFSD